MSIKIINWVWTHSTETGTNLLMLLAIADHANDDGVCWPSLARLAQRARVKERQAQYIIKRLEDSGAIEIRRGAGRNNTSVYIVKGASDCTISDLEKVQRTAPILQKKVQSNAQKGAVQRVEKVQSSAEKGAVAIAPDPSLEPSDDPSLEPSDDDDDDGASARPVPVQPAKRRNQPGTRHNRRTSVPEAPPSPPVAPPPPPPQVQAVASALVDHAICADDEQAQLTAARLLADHPAEWLIRAASLAAERKDVTNPYAYMLKVVENWHTEGGPRPSGRSRDRPQTEEDRRRKYIPEEYADVILG